MTTETRTIEAPGATLTYDVREVAGSTYRPLLLIGSPMDAEGFGTLAGHFADRTVVTYDPRGGSRSKLTKPVEQTTPVEHAADLAVIIAEVGAPVDVFASSGGAVNALELVARHPDLVHTLVAHEPPLAQFLPDRDEVVATCEAVRERYFSDGFGPAMASFIGLTIQQGPLPEGYASQPGPDAAAFGMPTEDDGSRDDALLAYNVHTCSPHEIDVDAVTTGATRVVIGVGEESGQQLAARGATALAEQIGVPPTSFPSDHAGFLGGEYGMTGKPDEFAARLRELLG